LGQCGISQEIALACFRVQIQATGERLQRAEQAQREIVDYLGFYIDHRWNHPCGVG
jgi:hypothetical protein